MTQKKKEQKIMVFYGFRQRKQKVNNSNDSNSSQCHNLNKYFFSFVTQKSAFMIFLNYY